MKSKVCLTAGLLAALVATAKEPIDFVDPMIGTGSKRADEGNAGGMMPYTGVPFGMWQWVPMTRLSEHGITSFSAYAKDFRGFIATRQPAPWMGEFGQISLMAQTGEAANCDYATRGVEMVKDKCVFTPYYSKVVTKDGLVSEVTASSRAAILRFTFPKGAKRRLVFDASRFFMSCFAIDRPQPGGIRFESSDGDRRVTAWNSDRCDSLVTPDLKNFAARFVIELSEPFVATGTYVGGEKHGKRPPPGRAIPWSDYPRISQSAGSREAEADLVGGWCDFGPGDAPVCVRIGNSFVSAEKARDNLVREAGDAFDFEALKASSKAAWTKQLAPMRIEASGEVKTIFYTAMYHALLFPREIDEYGQYYSGFDDAVHDGADSYTCYSMWDTYRSEHAFLTLAAPERVDGMMRSLLQNYKEGGWLPKWPSLTYTGAMMGDPASMILTEAYVKGFRGFDVNLAYEAAWKSATVPAHNDLGNNWRGSMPWRGYPCVRCGLTRYMEKGWVAADECFESVTRTQDFGLNDLAVAVLAEATGHVREAEYLRKRAQNYRNVWNADRKQFWPRDESGAWKPFWNGTGGHGDYTEATPETAVWNVAYDLDGLVKLLGGREATVRALDEFYAKHFYNPRRPQFSLHENEPTHHIAYIYNRLGEHAKCARTVRRILTEAYTTEPWGFEGNDDCGQMSSWYVLSSLGFYPMNTFTEWYEIGSPLVDRAELKIGAPYKPAVFTILARNQSKANCIVKSVKLNGVELKDRRIRHSDIVKGGTLEFEMTGDEDVARSRPSAALPPLVGDGVADDTAAIQARLDAGTTCVYLPPPPKEYVISKTLLIGSEQELRLDRFTRVRLAKGSSCFMLSNRHRETGDRRVALTGGIWDFDNVNQAPNPQQAHLCKPPVKIVMPEKHDPNFYMGILMSFKCVTDLQLRHVTFRNPGSYSCQLASVNSFRVDDITFDFDKWNPTRLNMDGIHLDGDCHQGRITDLFGTCFDDLVAINANDGCCSPKEAPITDIEVDGVHADYCHSAVRILSAGAEIRRITVRNVFGNFYAYAVGLTHHFPKKPRGLFEDIVIENVFAAKALSPEEIGVRSRVGLPLVWVEGPVDVGNLSVRNFRRDERTVPVASVRVDPKSVVRRLTVRDCRMANRLDEAIPFVEIKGRVGALVSENNEFDGNWTGAGLK